MSCCVPTKTCVQPIVYGEATCEKLKTGPDSAIYRTKTKRLGDTVRSVYRAVTDLARRVSEDERNGRTNQRNENLRQLTEMRRIVFAFENRFCLDAKGQERIISELRRITQAVCEGSGDPCSFTYDIDTEATTSQIPVPLPQEDCPLNVCYNVDHDGDGDFTNTSLYVRNTCSTCFTGILEEDGTVVVATHVYRGGSEFTLSLTGGAGCGSRTIQLGEEETSGLRMVNDCGATGYEFCSDNASNSLSYMRATTDVDLFGCGGSTNISGSPYFDAPFGSTVLNIESFVLDSGANVGALSMSINVSPSAACPFQFKLVNLTNGSVAQTGLVSGPATLSIQTGANDLVLFYAIKSPTCTQYSLSTPWTAIVGCP